MTLMRKPFYVLKIIRLGGRILHGKIDILHDA
jgi:hypothetical protein